MSTSIPDGSFYVRISDARFMLLVRSERFTSRQNSGCWHCSVAKVSVSSTRMGKKTKRKQLEWLCSNGKCL